MPARRTLLGEAGDMALDAGSGLEVYRMEIERKAQKSSGTKQETSRRD